MSEIKKSVRHFVIPLDINYLHKAIVCYKSLLQYHNNFVFNIFCFDDLTFNIVKKLDYKNIVPYQISKFETKELLESRSSKTRLYEYYWSCKPFLIKKIMDMQKANVVTYIDSDLMFFESPEIIFNEMNGADVLIQPNNFSYPQSHQFNPVGYYCSGFATFTNTKNGRKILNWWHKKCMEWCFAKFENGKFGDQKYMDDWRTRFKKVREITSVGSNVAPWNVRKYDITIKNNLFYISNTSPLIYYHFHGFRMNLSNYKYIITGDRHNNYIVQREVIDAIYEPYIVKMRNVIRDLKRIKEYRHYVKINPEGKYLHNNMNYGK